MSNITRKYIRENKDTIFLFGDNMEKKGFGGQAKEMRAEPNSIGIPTKWKPSMEEKAFFTDDDFHLNQVKERFMHTFLTIEGYLESGHNVVIPRNGIGTGLAQLEERAPLIFNMIQSTIKNLKKKYGVIEYV